MTIVFKLGDDGSFVAGDTETKLTSYAYPTSSWAAEAKRAPRKVAAVMIKSANREAWLRQDGAPAAQECREYDSRNWEHLNQAA